MIVTSMRQHAIRRRQLLIAVGGAIVVALALIVASHLSADSEPASAPTSSSGQAEVAGVACQRFLRGLHGLSRLLQVGFGLLETSSRGEKQASRSIRIAPTLFPMP